MKYYRTKKQEWLLEATLNTVREWAIEYDIKPTTLISIFNWGMVGLQSEGVLKLPTYTEKEIEELSKEPI